ncbi:hypothetical protein [Streptomyces nitrosporeus]
MNLTPLFDFLLHDVLGNLTAGILTTATGYLFSKIKHRANRTPDRDHPPQ